MAAQNVPLPPPLNIAGDLRSNWCKFKQLWDSYELITGLDKKNGDVRVATFITCIGLDALDIHNNLPYEREDDRKDMTKVLSLWSEYCVGKTNIIYERYQFNNCVQGSDEFDVFVVKLRTLVKSCNYGSLENDLLRDRIVCGVTDVGLRKKLLQESGMTLDRCIQICKAHSATQAQMQAMSACSGTVAYVKPKKSQFKPKTLSVVQECKFCGQSHLRTKEKCPAFGKMCKKCGKPNHFAKKCSSGQVKSKSKHKVRAVSEESEDSDEIMVVKDEKHYKKKIVGRFKIKSKSVDMQIDSGATINILPRKMVPEDVVVVHNPKRLNLYGKDASIVSMGTCNVRVTNPKNRKKYDIEFVVVEQDSMPLLGAETAQAMKLIEVKYENIAVVQYENIAVVDRSPPLSEPTSRGEPVYASKQDVLDHSEVFSGLGKMPGKVHLYTDDTVEPVVMPPRKVPISVKDKLKDELGRLEKLDVITKVTEPTEWVSGLVVVQKPSGKVRVCIDPQHLNKSLKRGHYPLPTIDDVLPMLNNVKVFTKADCKEGFLQCELDEESSYLTTFQTPWGRFRWKRMPFGISPAPEIFQCHLDQNLEGLPGMYKIADDILIVGRGNTVEDANRDHDRNLQLFLDRCADRGIRLNPDKFDFKADEVKFMGHILTNDGLKADPDKVTAVKNMPVPESVVSLQRFIGMVKYLAKFLPALSDMSEPLRRLTHKDCEWTWSDQQQKAFDMIKQKVCEAPVLRYFDASAPTEGQGDASQFGLGFALIQQGQPVAYASRALTPAETKYSQIEKELLAQVFGLERHHEYVYGRQVILWTDHKPLVAITQKPLATAPKRLQRLLLRLQQYDVRIQYMPGPQLHLADTLSRAFVDDIKRSQTEVEAECIHLIDGLRISEPTRLAIKQATANDLSLQKVVEYVCNGWPSTARECTNGTSQYFGIRHEITEDNGIIFKGLRCVIPNALRTDIRDKLHAAHTGIESTLKRARECVYWPSMTAELTDYIAKCPTCNEIPRSQQKESLHSHEIPSRPWEKVGCDLFEVDGNSYLCTVDYYSDYFEVDNLQGKKDAHAVIKRLKRHFSSHGIPDCVQSDNGPPFNSREFSEFAKQYGFKQTTSSPEYAQSNGKVESAVKIAKKLIKRAKRDHGDFYLSLLIWRNTPTASMNSSPAQRFLGRRTKNNVPMAAELLQPRVIHDVVERKKANQQRQAKYYNRNAKDLESLKIGDVVRIQPRKKHTIWEKAKVVERIDERSYLVETEDGVRRRRNRRHLRSTREAFHAEEDIQSPPPDGSERNVNEHVNTNQQPANVGRRSVRNKRPPGYLKDYVRM